MLIYKFFELKEHVLTQGEKMKKILNGATFKILIINQNPAVLVYMICCPFLILIFYVVMTVVL